MKNLGKMENVTLLKVAVDLDLQFYTYQGYEFRGIAWYRIGLKFYKVQFIYLENSDYKVAYFEGNYYDKHNRIPQNKLQNEALLALIRGEIEKYFGRIKQINFFEERREKEQEEERKRQEEEEKKRIALGEQISIDKYLLNRG